MELCLSGTLTLHKFYENFGSDLLIFLSKENYRTKQCFVVPAHRNQVFNSGKLFVNYLVYKLIKHFLNIS